MADILMLHAAGDAAVAGRLAQALRGEGLSVDLLAETPALANALETSKGVVVLWSQGALADPRVMDAAGVARDRGVLAPVRVDEIAPPLGFRQLQTADLTAFPSPESGPALHALATALLRLRDGRLARLTPRALDRYLGIRRFLLSPNFWLGGLLLAVLLGVAAALIAAQERSALSLPDRIAALVAPVIVMFVVMLLARAILHGSRRMIGLQTSAFFSLEYFATLAFGLLIAAGLAAWGEVAGVAQPDAAIGLRVIAALSFGGLAAAVAILVLRALRRLAFGVVRRRI